MPISNDITTVNLKVFGNVQGVSYRAWLRQKALELEISGWVRNCSDRSVEVMANGRKKNIDNFVQFSNIGPPNSEVKKVQVEIIDKVGEGGSFPSNIFQIINTISSSV